MDEATSALDYQAEKYVQQTLDKVSKGRTTIVVSHRLSAIRDADRILFIDKGHVIEDGTHSELMAAKGRYFEMVTAGNMDEESESEEEDEEHENVVDEVKQNGIEIPKRIELNRAISEQKNNRNYIRALSVDEMEKELEKEKKLADEEESEASDHNIQYWEAFKRILSLTKPEWMIMFLATVSAAIIGASLPLFAILFGEVYGVSQSRKSHLT